MGDNRVSDIFAETLRNARMGGKVRPLFSDLPDHWKDQFRREAADIIHTLRCKGVRVEMDALPAQEAAE